MTPKLFIGTVSKNVVDAAIEFSKENNIGLGLILSRRQIDYDGGYVNLWTTKNFAEYVNSKQAYKVCLQRDHGGIGQGKPNIWGNDISDDDYISFAIDLLYLDLIHIDPWKKLNFKDGVKYTIDWIEKLNNGRLMFEVGTESAIRKFTLNEFDSLLNSIKIAGLIDKVKYAVIQSGTSLLENSNVGIYTESHLKDMIEICKKYNVCSKEHNADYLTTEIIQKKFDLGLDSVNIAPEFGMIESCCYINCIKENNPLLLDDYYEICFESKTWKKWVSKKFDISNKEKLIKICGHYVLSTKEFHSKIEQKLPNIDNSIKIALKSRMREIIE